jgi:hypothetical protein
MFWRTEWHIWSTEMIPYKAPFGRVVHARSRWHQQSCWFGSKPNTTQCGVECTREYLSKRLAIRNWWKKGGCFLSWKIVYVYFFVRSDALTDDYNCEGASYLSLCLLGLWNVQATLFKDSYAYQQTYVACWHIHQNPHRHPYIVSTFSLKELVYRQTRLLRKNNLL